MLGLRMSPTQALRELDTMQEAERNMLVRELRSILDEPLNISASELLNRYRVRLVQLIN